METDITIKGIRQKDHKIFKHFYDEFYEDLVRYAYTYLYDQAYSEDMVAGGVYMYLGKCRYYLYYYFPEKLYLPDGPEPVSELPEIPQDNG